MERRHVRDQIVAAMGVRGEAGEIAGRMLDIGIGEQQNSGSKRSA